MLHNICTVLKFFELIYQAVTGSGLYIRFPFAKGKQLSLALFLNVLSWFEAFGRIWL